MLRICRTLSGAGYEVWLLGRGYADSPPLNEEVFTQRRLPCIWRRGKAFYLEYNLRLFFFLLFRRWDIVCAVDLDTLLPAFIAARLMGRSLAHDAHEYYTESPELVGRPWEKKTWEALATWLIPRVRHQYTVSASLAEALERRYGRSFVVVRNLPERREPLVAEALARPPVILYQGVLNLGRGLEQAIAAMSMLPAAELWLAGEGDLSVELRRLAANSPAAKRIKFLGWVPPSALPALSVQAYVGLNLLQNLGLSYYYSLANKALDYIQAGVPSLQMDFPEYRRLQEEYEPFHLVVDCAPETIAQALRRLLEDEEYYARLRANCRRAARALTWEREAPLLLAFYEGIK
jgi:glycosyltransferase involved in cell wall biosynthesis